MKTFPLTSAFGTQIECCLKAIPERRYIQIYYRTDYGWEPWATASIQIDGLSGDEIAIKNYSENCGILDTLISLGVITPPHRRVSSGYIFIDICQMNYETLMDYSM